VGMRLSGGIVSGIICEHWRLQSKMVFANCMCQVRQDILGVLKAPLADIESIDVPPYQLFRVERGIPRLERDVSEHNAAYVEVGRLVAITLYRQR